MQFLTPEKLYEIWHQEINSYKGRLYVRPIKSFKEFRNSTKKVYFDKCVTFIANNNIDPVFYFKSIIEYFDGSVYDYSILASFKSIEIYKKYLNSINFNEVEVITELKRNFIFLSEYLAKNNIKTINIYLEENKFLIPTVFRHLIEKNISLYFLSIIPNVEVYIEEYPKDVILTYLKTNYKNKLFICKNRIISTTIGLKMCQEFEKILDKAKEKYILKQSQKTN